MARQVVVLLLLSMCACRTPVRKARTVTSGPGTLASWNKGFAFEDSQARLTAKGGMYFFELIPERGAGTVAFLTRGWSESRTVNFLQFEAVVMVLPAPLSVGSTYELRWADRASPGALLPGNVVALGRYELAVESAVKPGGRAGTVRVLETRGRTLRLEVNLAIPYEGWYVNSLMWGRIQNKWSAEVRAIKAPCKVRPFPEGASQTVGKIRLGRMVEE